MKRNKIFYLCNRGANALLHLYLGWVSEAQKRGVPITLVTTISFKEFLKKKKLSFKYRKGIYIPCPAIFDNIVVILFFLYQFISNKFTLIQLKKRDPKLFERLKRIFPEKFKYIIESEGDLEYEYDFLEKNPFTNNFYRHILHNKNKKLEDFKLGLIKADHIICVSENLKNVYTSRYLINKNKITALTTGCDSNKFYYNKSIREQWRNHLGVNSNFVFIYIGNIYYSWQNISRTLKIYNIAKKIKNNIRMIIITRKQDREILEYFLKRNNVNSNELILKFSIPNSLIPNYLNASDVGIILRDNHPMNQVAAPGKFGEYACCGLPILTGKGVADFSEKLSKTSYGIVLEDIHDDQEFKMKFMQLMTTYNKIDRCEISKWGVKHFSFKNFSKDYTKLLVSLMGKN